MTHFKNKITGFARLVFVLLAGFVSVSCGGGGGSQPSGGTNTPGGTNTGLVVIASGTVNPLGGTVADTPGETAVVAQPGATSGDATITVERGRDATGHVVTRMTSSSPTAIPVDIVLPPPDVLENALPSVTTSLATGVITAPFVSGDTKFPCSDNDGIDKDWFHHCSYFWKSTSIPGIGNRIESKNIAIDILGGIDITYREASVLSSTCAFSNSSCYVGKQPVLFVHGYSPTDSKASDNGFGGGVDTWGVFPFAMVPDYVPFEFRWVTATRFQDAAVDLGRAIDQIAERTGKKVHIVAHSFGGILTRTYLQGLASGREPHSRYPYNKNVATLTTIGTPHSGIFGTVQPSKIITPTIQLPVGQDSSMNLCGQLSCYQMGVPLDLVGFKDSSFSFNAMYTQNQAAAIYGVTTDPGEITENLYKESWALPAVPIQVLIGLTTSRSPNNTAVDNGDGLISYQGQRFLPTDGAKLSSGRYPTLHSSFQIGGASITEKILGFNGDVQPGEANPFVLGERVGYRHAQWPIVPCDANPMVAIEKVDGVGCQYSIPSVSRANHAAVIDAKNWIADWIIANPNALASTVQKFTLAGSLTDAVTGQPLSNARLEVSRDGVNMGTTKYTDVTGAFSLNLDFRPTSNYDVTISKDGYVSTAKIVPTTSSLDPVVNRAWTLNPKVGTVVPIIHALYIIKSGDGMVVGGGISCSPVCNTSFKEGELATLFAQADQGASFTGWSGCDITSVGSRCDVTMSSGKVVTASFTLVTGATPITTTPALSITTTSLPSVTVGTGYAQGVAVNGGQTPYTWSVSSGLPSGLNINSTTGAIYGYPSVPGTFSFTVTAKDSSSPQKSASQALSLTVTSSSTITCNPPQVLTNGVCVPPTNTFSISGSAGLPGVTMTMSGANSGGATSDANGNFTFGNLASGSYTIAPALSGYSFTPSSLVITVNGANITAANFTATSQSGILYSITGTVTASGYVLSGVTMTLSGANSGAYTTGSNGMYGFALLANGSYTVTPALSGYTFSPASSVITISGANIMGANFTGSASSTLTAPAVQSLAATSVTSTFAQLNASVNPNGSSTTTYFEYGTTTSYGSTTGVGGSFSGTTAAAVNYSMSGLSPNTTYHYRVVATNSGGTSRGGDVMFTTATALAAPTAQSLAATLVTSTTAQMNGSINPNGLSTSGYFEYGTTTGYGNSTGSGTFSGTSAITIQSGWSALTPNTTYHYRAVATNSGGTSRGGDVMFTTTATQLVVNGVASSYFGTGQKTIPLSGSGFNSLSQISWSCTMPNGTTPCTGSPYVWSPGTTRWSNVTITSDTAATVYPTFLIASDSPGTYYWNVTFSGGGQSVTKYFTAIK